MEKIKRKRTRRRILAIGLSCSITASLFTGVAMVTPVVVYAANPFQVGAFILSMLTALGQTPASSSITNYMINDTTLSQQITSYEQIEGISSAIDQALAADLGTARITAQLSNSSADMTILKENLISAGADPEKVRLLPDTGATAGENIEAAMKEYFNNGELSQSYGGKTLSETGLQTAFGMTALAYEGAKLGNFQAFQEYARNAGLTQEEIDAAVDSGAAFGDPSAFDDYIKAYRKTISNGLSASTPQNQLNLIPEYSSSIYVRTGGRPDVSFIYCGEDGVEMYLVKGGDYLYTGYVSKTSSGNIKVASYNYTFGNLGIYNITVNKPYGITTDNGGYRYGFGNSAISFYSVNDFNDWAERYVNGQATAPDKGGSPSVSDNDGNLKGSYDPNNPTQPYNINVNPTYNVNNYNMNPIPTLQDYAGVVEDLENNFNENISNDDVVPNFINPFLVPRDVIDPGPVDPDPDPTTAPNPTTPMPTGIPPQPTAAPLPTLTPEQEGEMPKYMNQPDLTSKFPFCIPFDLAMIFALFSSDIRQAPVFDWDLNFGPAGVHHIHIDFSPYDPAAALFRLLMLIFFVFSLALGTHRLVHPEGP